MTDRKQIDIGDEELAAELVIANEDKADRVADVH